LSRKNGSPIGAWKKRIMRTKASGLIAILICAVVAYFLFRDEFVSTPVAGPALPDTRSQIQNAPTRSVSDVPEIEAASIATPSAPAAESTVEIVDLPSIAERDAFVRERLEPFDLPANWVSQEDLVQRFSVLIDNATRGDWPHRPRRFLKPARRFAVVERDGRLYADPRNAARFDADLDLLESIEPAAAVRLLNTIAPLIDSALRNLGRPVSSAETILEAIDWILEAPGVPGDFELIQPKVLYEYADPAIESLAPLEKQLLRLGPKNSKRLKVYLGRLREEFVRP
jgi:hypothetical protein